MLMGLAQQDKDRYYMHILRLGCPKFYQNHYIMITTDITCILYRSCYMYKLNGISKQLYIYHAVYARIDMSPKRNIYIIIKR